MGLGAPRQSKPTRRLRVFLRQERARAREALCPSFGGGGRPTKRAPRAQGADDDEETGHGGCRGEVRLPPCGSGSF